MTLKKNKHYQNDKINNEGRKGMAKVNELFQDKEQEAFDNWCKELDRVHHKYSATDGSLVKETGVECWVEYYKDGHTPEEAYAEDCANCI